ncbi:hypothetical protein ACS126_12205 [Sphingobacterium lactis]|uniref:hypothetical protein n=1 Tax=Sphingobacterium lactis TaxID=797291 RepID=UPI003EC6760B
MKKFFYISTITLFCLISFNSCKKLDYEDGFKNFGEVFFLSGNLASALEIRIGSSPINWDLGSGKTSVPEGENTFLFFDKEDGRKLGEKKINVELNNPDTFLLFHPIKSVPIAFLDPNGQTNEESAPDGFIKLKIANYAGDLTAKELDIIVFGLNMNLDLVELATLESVTDNLGEEEYRLVPTGGNDILAYTFKFRDRKTQQVLKNHAGEDYWNQNVILYPGSMSPIPEKRVYTIYMRTYEQWGEFPSFIKSGDKYYEINPEILYAD